MIDSKGNDFQEVAIGSEFVRITYVKEGWNNSPSIRIQMKDETGHLRPGPEIPNSSISGVVREIVELLAANSKVVK